MRYVYTYMTSVEDEELGLCIAGKYPLLSGGSVRAILYDENLIRRLAEERTLDLDESVALALAGEMFWGAERTYTDSQIVSIDGWLYAMCRLKHPKGEDPEVVEEVCAYLSRHYGEKAYCLTANNNGINLTVPGLPDSIFAYSSYGLWVTSSPSFLNQYLNVKGITPPTEALVHAGD